MKKEFESFLPLFNVINDRLKKGRMTLAIDGLSASGKTTLAKLLEEKYECTVFHMDDFFLQPFQRTKERYEEIGGNIDRERFLDQVLKPLFKGEKIKYQPFDCSVMTLLNTIEVTPKKLTVIEGVYSMHPLFLPYYDYSVFLQIDKELQKERILKRNTPAVSKRFFNEWIPMENRYFESFNIKEKCNMIIFTR